MKIVVPMAGRGRRFADHGYEMPKPLIEVAGRPMLLWALEGLMELEFSQLILIVLAEHEVRFEVSKMVAEHFSERLSFSKNALQVIAIPDVTEGQLCTTLAAKSLICKEEDVLVAASDTFIKSNLAKDIREKPAACAGIISVANLPGEQWSFARTDETGRVLEVAEKRRISDHASSGLYYFSKGSDLVFWGEEMIRGGERTRGEFYVIPVYQKLIDAGQLVGISHASEMWDMGTPEAKARFEAHFKK
jgi:UDP-N-acetylglucosamine diphosphorylase / glucose-1-phosphate thymidylyltransferase / UDP-N-acetylgalactosamine diphosphorylase / glucosamine-1-phosphate N-acetyltransferase / galactosamine-1-phosphate N-acetyltransferase